MGSSMTLEERESTTEAKAAGLGGARNRDDDYYHSISERFNAIPSERPEVPHKVKTFGFKDGKIIHDMPCPVCLSASARYISSGDEAAFHPCESCAGDGWTLQKG